MLFFCNFDAISRHLYVNFELKMLFFRQNMLISCNFLTCMHRKMHFFRARNARFCGIFADFELKMLFFGQNMLEIDNFLTYTPHEITFLMMGVRREIVDLRLKLREISLFCPKSSKSTAHRGYFFQPKAEKSQPEGLHRGYFFHGCAALRAVYARNRRFLSPSARIGGIFFGGFSPACAPTYVCVRTIVHYAYVRCACA